MIRVLATGFYVVRPDQRAVLTTFGRADRLPSDMIDKADGPHLGADEQQRYHCPKVRVIGPGGPYFKWPWQKVHKVSVATQAVDLVWDPTRHQNTVEAVTKDNLTTGVNGQIRFRVCQNNLYAYLFGVASPLEHVIGYFVAVLRERIANFADPKGQSLIADSEVEGERSETANKVSQKMAEAKSTRPAVVGRALNEIAHSDPEILRAVLDVMEADRLLSSQASVDVLPNGASVIVQFEESATPRPIPASTAS
jgi:regulator of protease activity HflC (stomatin/prohibitin superfamily)